LPGGAGIAVASRCAPRRAQAGARATITAQNPQSRNPWRNYFGKTKFLIVSGILRTFDPASGEDCLNVRKISNTYKFFHAHHWTLGSDVHGKIEMVFRKVNGV
jgi:hypothetical protein